MKTPEDIKKGLECGFCHECPYYNDEIETVEECARHVHKDALAYIRQLEERNKTLEYTLLGVMHSIDKWLDVEPYDFDKDDGTEAATRAANDREVALKAIEQLESRLAQVERERDAAVHDLWGDCVYCAFNNLSDPVCIERCSKCKHAEDAETRESGLGIDRWQWRGVCAANTEEGN